MRKPTPEIGTPIPTPSRAVYVLMHQLPRDTSGPLLLPASALHTSPYAAEPTLVQAFRTIGLGHWSADWMSRKRRCGRTSHRWRAASNSTPALGQQDGHLAVGSALVIRVRRVGGYRALPPDVSLLTFQLAGMRIEAVAAILHHQRVRVSLEVVVPVGMLGSTTLRSDQCIHPVVLDTHQSHLPDLAALSAPGGEDYDRQTGVEKRVGFSAVGRLVAPDLLSDPALWAWLVLSTQRHFVSPPITLTNSAGGRPVAGPRRSS